MRHESTPRQDAQVEQSNQADTPKRRSDGRGKLLGDYVSMVGFNALSIVLSFANTSLILSLLGRTDYGEIVSSVSTSLLIVLISTEWTQQALVRFGTAEHLESGRVRVVFWNRLYLALSCVMTASVLLVSIYGLFGSRLGLPRQAVVFSLAYLPIQVYWLQLQRILPPIGLPRLLYPLLCLERLMILGVIGMGWLTDRLSIEMILAGYFAGCLTAGIITTLLVRKKIARPAGPDRNELGRILRFSWPLIPSVSIGAMATNTIDYIFVRRYVGPAQLGVYSLGIQISGVVQQLPQIAGTLVTPRVIGLRLKGDHERLDRFVRRDFVRIQWAWVTACFAGASLAAWLGPQYIPSNYMLLIDLIWPLAIVTAILPMWYLIWSPILTAFEGTRTIMWATMVAGMVNVVSNATLIPRLGATGSAWATVLSFATPPLISEYLVSRSGSREIPRRGFSFYIPVLLMGATCVSMAAILSGR
ncbi:oligosaccharide flippase family protein [bacterium]|nr:oligosaccharide flippase family protein [bacterium]